MRSLGLIQSDNAAFEHIIGSYSWSTLHCVRGYFKPTFPQRRIHWLLLITDQKCHSETLPSRLTDSLYLIRFPRLRSLKLNEVIYPRMRDFAYPRISQIKKASEYLRVKLHISIKTQTLRSCNFYFAHLPTPHLIPRNGFLASTSQYLNHLWNLAGRTPTRCTATLETPFCSRQHWWIRASQSLSSYPLIRQNFSAHL